MLGAHPLCAANNRLTLGHVEQLILMFSVFELNGARNNVQNDALRQIVADLTPESTARMEEKHGLGRACRPALAQELCGRV